MSTVNDWIRRGHAITLAFIIIFGIVELGISGWLTRQFRVHHNAHSDSERYRVHYTLFASAWTVFFGFVYLFAFIYKATGFFLTSVASHFVFTFFSWVFWLAAAASITQFLDGGLSCNTQDVFVYCKHLNTLEGVAWIEWIAFTFALVVVTIRAFNASHRGEGYRGGLVTADNKA